MTWLELFFLPFLLLLLFWFLRGIVKTWELLKVGLGSALLCCVLWGVYRFIAA